MFDVGFWEILLILILALVIIGPERLPAAARQAGFFVGKARRYIEGVRSEVESELDVSEFKRMLHNQEVQLNELRQQLQDGADKVTEELPKPDILTDVPAHSFYDGEEAAAATGSHEKSSAKSSESLQGESSTASSEAISTSDDDTGDDKSANRRTE